MKYNTCVEMYTVITNFKNTAYMFHFLQIMLETISILKVQPNAALKKESVTCVFSNMMIGYLQFTYLESYPPYKIRQGKAYSIVTKPQF